MKYPKLINTLLYKKEDSSSYIVRNAENDNDYRFDKHRVAFMNRLDGNTNPYSITSELTETEIDEFIDFLEDEKLIRTSIFVNNGLLTYRIPLFKIKASLKMRAISYLLNFGLMISFLPLLVIGCVVFPKSFNFDDFCMPLFIAGNIIGTILSLVLHETGHAIAGLAFNAKVFEAGLLVGIMNGAYVSIDEKYIKSKMKRVQIMGAGVEMNFALAGVSLICTAIFGSLWSFFFAIGIVNIVMASINLIFILGLDGFQIINILLGADLFSSIFDLVFDEKFRKRLVKDGVIGYTKINACLLTVICQLAYPAMIILNIVSFGSVFI